jgi:hypothetical protein
MLLRSKDEINLLFSDMAEREASNTILVLAIRSLLLRFLSKEAFEALKEQIRSQSLEVGNIWMEDCKKHFKEFFPDEHAGNLLFIIKHTWCAKTQKTIEALFASPEDVAGIK